MPEDNGKKSSSPENLGNKQPNGINSQTSSTSMTQPDHDTGDRKRRRLDNDAAESSTRLIKIETEALRGEMQELRKANTEVLARLQNFQTTESQQTIIRQRNHIARLEGRDQTRSLDWLQDLTYSRTSKYSTPVGHIEEYMIGLESAAEELVALMAKDEETFTKTANFKRGKNPDLFKFVQTVVVKQTGDKSEAWYDYAKRGIIAASVSAWVFDSSFPMSKKDVVVEEMQSLLVERGGEEAARFLDCLRRDARYFLSRKPDLLNVAVPNRAEELSVRFAKIMAPFMPAAKDGKEDIFNNVEGLEPGLALWLAKIKTIFLVALNFFIKIQQLSATIIMYWPSEHSVFDIRKMRALNKGQSHTFTGNEVLLTIMPAAMIQGDNGKETVLSKAVVYLGTADGKSASEEFQSGRHLRQIVDVQYSEDTRTVSCSSCGINRLVFDAKKDNHICSSCSARLEKNAARPPKGRDAEANAAPSSTELKGTAQTSRASTVVGEVTPFPGVTKPDTKPGGERQAAREAATAEPDTATPSGAGSAAKKLQEDEEGSYAPNSPATHSRESEPESDSDSNYDDDSDASFKPSNKLSVLRKAQETRPKAMSN